jgi:hypothetical protein
VRQVLITVGSSSHEVEVLSLRWTVLVTAPSGLPRRRVTQEADLSPARAVDAPHRGVRRLSVVAARDEDQVNVLAGVDRGIDQT